MKRFVVGITGASGAIYGARLIEALLHDPGHEVHLIVTPAGARVMEGELPGRPRLDPCEPRSWLEINEEQARRIVGYDCQDIGAGPASGTFPAAATIVCPCSMRTLGAAAAGLAENLLTRAADVAMKEGRPLVLVPRETPLSLIHLRNMTRLAEAGAIILPAAPGFYHQPQTIDDLVRFVVQKIFDRLGLDFPNPIRWGE